MPRKAAELPLQGTVAQRREARLRRSRRRRKIVAAVVVAATVAFGGWSFARSEFFALSRIQVAGERTVSEREVVAASALRIGQNVLGLDVDAVRRRVEALRVVRRAEVVRAASTVVLIRITERVPVLEVRADRHQWYLDEDGVRVDAAPGADRLPVLRIGQEEDRQPPPGRGDRFRRQTVAGPAMAVGAWDARIRTLAADAAAVRGVLAVWRALPEAVTSRVRWFRFAPSGTVSFGADDTEVVVGRAVDLKEKIAALTLVLRRLDQEGKLARRIDVRAPSRPAAVLAG